MRFFESLNLFEDILLEMSPEEVGVRAQRLLSSGELIPREYKFILNIITTNTSSTKIVSKGKTIDIATEQGLNDYINSVGNRLNAEGNNIKEKQKNYFLNDLKDTIKKSPAVKKAQSIYNNQNNSSIQRTLNRAENSSKFEFHQYGK